MAPPRKSNRVQSQSQNGSKSGSQRSQNTQLSQLTLEEVLEEPVNFDEQANDIVRFIIIRGGDHMIFRKNDLQKAIGLKSGRYLEEILSRVRRILQNVYGYSLNVCDQTNTSAKAYIVSNCLPYIEDPEVSEEIPSDANKILLMLILTHIFMSNNSVSEHSLYSFLKLMGINVEVRHTIFGQVKEYITQDLTKHRYLNIEIDNMSKKLNFSWGIRAEKEISKHELLKFVCKIFKGRAPKSWVNQFQVANAQVLENEPATEEEG